MKEIKCEICGSMMRMDLDNYYTAMSFINKPGRSYCGFRKVESLLVCRNKSCFYEANLLEMVRLSEEMRLYD